jgi:natural product precursor
MMKPKQSTRKLNLNKQSISNLSKMEMQVIKGGVAAFTTSWVQCTGITCCPPATKGTGIPPQA